MSSKLLSALSLFLFCVPGVISAAPEWGYDSVVEPLARPDWLDRVYLFEPAYQPVLEAGQTAPWVKQFQAAGIELCAMYPDGFCQLSGDPATAPWARACREEVARMHAIGIRCLAGCYPFVGSRGPGDLVRAHPEWRKLKADGTPEGEDQACMLHPGFSTALRELLVSRVRDFDIDGFQFDGWYQREFCGCASCKSLYRAETGVEAPPRVDPSSPAYLRYLVWRDRVLLEKLIELQKALKQVKPSAVLVNWNCNDAAGAAPSSMPEALNCIADWTNKEWWDAFDVHSIYLNLRLRGSTGNDRPPGMQPYMFMRWGKDIQAGVYHGSSTPLPEVLYRTHEVLAMGGIPIIWTGVRQGWKPSDWAPIRQGMLDFLPLVHQTRTTKWAVVIDSFTTLQCARIKVSNRAFHEGEGNEADSAVGNFRGGVTRALLEEHLPLDVISEHNVTVERLRQYRVAILPNNFAMSDRIVQVLGEYVRGGGGLVATFLTSSSTAAGEPRQGLALEELFGAKVTAVEPVGPSRIAFTAQKHPVTDDPALRDLMGPNGYTTYWGPYVRVSPVGAVDVPLQGLDVRLEKDESRRNWIPLLCSTRGAGRVAYFPAGIDAAYFDAGYPYQRLLLAGAARWAAGDAPGISVRAPMCILARYLERVRDGKLSRIVHLLNGINTTTGHGSKNDKEYAFREEIVPVGGCSVAFTGKRPSRIWLAPGGMDLEPRETERGWEVEVPPIPLHVAVVAVSSP